MSVVAQNLSNQFDLMEKLSKVRVRRGVSEQDLADYLDVDVRIIERVETGEYELNLTELRFYAAGIGVVIRYEIEEYT